MQDYKSLCAAVTICATLANDPKLNFYILTPMTLKTWSECVSWCIRGKCTYNANVVTAQIIHISVFSTMT